MKLHSYQELARDFLRKNPKAALMLDMGLGKTAVTLSALSEDHLPALVIAPKRVAEEVWPEEQPVWRKELALNVAAGSPAERQKQLDYATDITVIGQDNIKDVLNAKRPFRTIVLDELSGYKNQASKRWKTVRKILKRFQPEYVYGLTGSPSPNGLIDLWAQIYLLDEGERLGKTLTGFRNRYFYPGWQLPNGVVAEWKLREYAEERIHEKISDICLYMSSEDKLDLPEMTFNEIHIPMPKHVQTVYKKMEDDFIADLDLLGGEVHTAKNAAVLSGKLSQVSAGFMYVDDADLRDHEYDVIHCEKTRAAQEIVDGTGSPVLIFYQFQAELDALKAQFGSDAHTISEKDAVKRWNAGEIPVLLAHPASAGHGLNLQHGGHTVIWSTLPWSLEHWEQGNRRLSRQGQKHPVIVHTLMMDKSIDWAMMARLRDKMNVQQALFNYLESPL